MEIIKEGKLNKLIATSGYLLKSKDDIYIKSYVDEDGNVIEEHLPYGFEYAYIPESITLETAQSLYDELLAEDYPWKPEEPKEETMDTIWGEALLDGLK